MKRAAWMVFALTSLAALAGPAFCRGLMFEPAEYAARRQNLMDRIPDGAAVIFGSQTATEWGLSQNNDFIYFCGVEIPRAILVVDGQKKESSLFFTFAEREARGLGIASELVRDPARSTGIAIVYPREAFSGFLQRLAARTPSPVLYTPFLPEERTRDIALEESRSQFQEMAVDPWDGRPGREQQFVKLLRERFPQVEVQDATASIRALRRIKSKAEAAVMRRAGKIAARAVTEVMRTTRPGMHEYELSSLFEYLCKSAGCRDLAFNTIISSAENHAFIHYTAHDRLLADGDFLVIDAGPDCDYYDVDLSVSFPASGRFSARQREIYTACHEVNKACLMFYRPGITGFQVGERAREYLQGRGYDLSRDAFGKLRFFREGALTHFVGLAVHDAAGKDLDPAEPLQPGMVFAADVYAVFAEENLGVRVENTVLITEEGCENLTGGIPREIGEIESLMKQSGVVQILRGKGLYHSPPKTQTKNNPPNGK